MHAAFMGCIRRDHWMHHIDWLCIVHITSANNRHAIDRRDKKTTPRPSKGTTHTRLSFHFSEEKAGHLKEKTSCAASLRPQKKSQLEEELEALKDKANHVCTAPDDPFIVENRGVDEGP
jgi:hypothetical protein